MSNLFSGINARLRGASAKSENKSPTSSQSSQPQTPTSTGGFPSSSSAGVLQSSSSSGPNLGTMIYSAGPGGAGSSASSSTPVSLAVGGAATGSRRGNVPPLNLSGSQSSSSVSRLPPLPNSPSLAQSIGMNENGDLRGLMPPSADELLASYHLPRPLPLWLNPAYAKHIVKGNFMTLSARPKTVEQGEWIAHQIIEHYRNLWNFVRVLHEKEDDGVAICNSTTCPRMSAGVNHSFTWLNARREPVELPAYEYITLMQRWISGKIDDTRIFPTDASGVSYALNPSLSSSNSAQGTNGSASANGNGNGNAPSLVAGPGGSTGGNSTSTSNSTPTLSALTSPGGLGGVDRDWLGRRSGFPENFVDVCQTIFRQMFRVYAHLYWAHFVEPLYHLNLEKQLNSCFSHFVLTATALDMLKPHELEPMQPLIDLWAANGTFPQGSKAYEFANTQVGERLLRMAGMAA